MHVRHCVCVCACVCVWETFLRKMLAWRLYVLLPVIALSRPPGSTSQCGWDCSTRSKACSCCMILRRQWQWPILKQSRTCLVIYTEGAPFQPFFTEKLFVVCAYHTYRTSLSVTVSILILHVTSSRFCLYLLIFITLHIHFYTHIQRHTHTSTHVWSAHKMNDDNQAQEPGWKGRKKSFCSRQRPCTHQKKCQQKRYLKS